MSEDTAVPASFGSRLLGRADDSARARRVRVKKLVFFSVIIANLVGMALAITLSGFVLPGPSIWGSDSYLVDFVATPVFMVSALVVGVLFGVVESSRTLGWTKEDRAPTEREAHRVFGMPWRLTLAQGALWFFGAALFALLDGLVDPALIPKSLLGALLSAILVCTVSYVLTEFSLRPVAALVLHHVQPRKRRGVARRFLVYWTLSTATPILVLVVLGIDATTTDTVSKQRLAVVVLSFGGIVLFAGLYVTYLTIRAITVPIGGLRSAVRRIGNGDFAARVIAYDGTEIGELQSWFNLTARGLEEREEIREVFGRHVGKGVARAALAQTPELGGEERAVAVLFVDIIGSTTIAATRPPIEVVRLLNRFFKVVVAEVDERGGFINKFEGDGALAVFGAPSHLEDPAGSALQAARAIKQRLSHEVPECQAGVGVSYGFAVAGNIGSDERFEYTVIGDPVNEASGLCERAKATPGKVLASASAIAAAVSSSNSATNGEAEQWAPHVLASANGGRQTHAAYVTNSWLPR